MEEHSVKQTWTLAIETMSWIELKDVTIPTALARTTKQLRIEDNRTVATANRLVRETLHRRNFIDKIIEKSLAPSLPDNFNLGA